MTTIEYYDDKQYTPLEELIKSSQQDAVTKRVRAATLRALEKLYKEQGLTVRQICELYGARYDNNIQKMFIRLFGPKGLGLGGDRRSKKFKSTK